LSPIGSTVEISSKTEGRALFSDEGGSAPTYSVRYSGSELEGVELVVFPQREMVKSTRDYLPGEFVRTYLPAAKRIVTGISNEPVTIDRNPLIMSDVWSTEMLPGSKCSGEFYPELARFFVPGSDVRSTRVCPPGVVPWKGGQVAPYLKKGRDFSPLLGVHLLSLIDEGFSSGRAMGTVVTEDDFSVSDEFPYPSMKAITTIWNGELEVGFDTDLDQWKSWNGFLWSGMGVRFTSGSALVAKYSGNVDFVVDYSAKRVVACDGAMEFVGRAEFLVFYGIMGMIVEEPSPLSFNFKVTMDVEMEQTICRF